MAMVRWLAVGGSVAVLAASGLVAGPATAGPPASGVLAADLPPTPSLPAIAPWSQPSALSAAGPTTPVADLDATYDGIAAAAVWSSTSGTTTSVQAAGVAGGTWFPTTTLDTATATRAAYRPTPLPAVDMAEDAWFGIAVWLDGGDAPYAVKVATWTVDGWGTPVTVAAASSAAPALSVQPQVAVSDDGSSAAVTWVARGSAGAYATSGYVYVSTWSQATNAWTAGINLSNDGASQPVVAMSGTGTSVPAPGSTAVTVAWTAYNASFAKNQIQFRSLPGTAGAGWTAIDDVDNAPPEVGFDALELTLSSDGRSAALGYTEVGILETSVRAAVVSGAGAPWSTTSWRIRQLSTQNAGNPAVALSRDGSSALAVWPQEVGNDLRLLGSAWRPTSGGGGTWSGPVAITAATDPDAALPQLTLAPDGSSATLAFCYQAAGVGVASWSPSAGWGAVIGGAAATGCNPQIATTSNGFATVLVWSGPQPGTPGSLVWGALMSTERISYDRLVPAAGAVAGGTSVAIQGATWPGGLTSVLFDGLPATITQAGTALTVTTPPHAAGPVDLQIISSLGSALFASAFTYQAPPTITAISPSAGPTSGGPVTVTGSNLGPVDGISFGSGSGTVTSTSATSVRATAPNFLSPGWYSVSVASSTAGTSNTLNAAYRVAAAPTITSVAPAAGPAGSTVRITGSGLWGATSVTFGGVPGTAVTVLSDSALTATIPALAAGPVSVSVTTPGGTVTRADAVTVLPPAPVLSGVAPLSGPVSGGTVVTLTGSHLSATSAVSFGGTPAASFEVASDSIVTATTPAHVAGSVDVAVTTPGGSVSRPQGFTYVAPQPPEPVVARVEPASGPVAGGTPVSVVGSGFTGASALSFDGVPATDLVVVDDSTITATTPPGDAGPAHVVVTTPVGSSTTVAAFTYVAPSIPVLGSLSPTSGTTLGGTQVTVTGSGFSHVTSVTFGGDEGTLLRILDDGTLTVVTPSHPSGSVDVAVEGTAGSDSQADAFTYVQPAPVIASVSPPSGPDGTVVTIAGDNLTGTTTVTFGGDAATGVAVVDDQTVTATAPAHDDGPVDVSLTAAGGSTTSAGAFTYATPTLTAVTPALGSTAGGTAATLTGTHLSGVTGVTFGGTAASSVIIVDDTTVTAVTPPHDAGTVDVAVSLGGGGTVSLDDAYTYASPPLVTAVSPTTGPAAGGQSVTVSGSGLAGTDRVDVGGAAATGLVVSASSVTALTPAGDPGSADVAVTTPVGTAIDEDAYSWVAAPTLSSVRPASGPTTGGTALTITGSNLIGAAVRIGGVPVTSVSTSATAVSVAAPPAAPGSVDVEVSTAGGTATLSGGFSYVAPAPAPGPAPQPPVPPAPVPVTSTLTVTTSPAGTGRVRIVAKAAPAFGRSGTVLLKHRHRGRVTWQRVARTPDWPNRAAGRVRFTVRLPRGKDAVRLSLPGTPRGTAVVRTVTVRVR